jgi:hypothetical protein
MARWSSDRRAFFVPPPRGRKKAPATKKEFSMNARLSSPMGNWQERGTIVPTQNGRTLIQDPQEFKRIVWNAISQLPAAEQEKAKRSLAGGEEPTPELLNLMRKVIENS